jgi:hypothetical protein
LFAGHFFGDNFVRNMGSPVAQVAFPLQVALTVDHNPVVPATTAAAVDVVDLAGYESHETPADFTMLVSKVTEFRSHALVERPAQFHATVSAF